MIDFQKDYIKLEFLPQDDLKAMKQIKSINENGKMVKVKFVLAKRFPDRVKCFYSRIDKN